MTESERMGSFRTADIDQNDADRLMIALDLIAASPAVQRLKAWALRSLAPQPGERALDVGSGTGEDVQAFASLVGPGGAFGVEPNPSIRAEAEQRATAAGASVQFDSGDGYELPYPDGSFDCVRSERVFQHLDHPERAAAEIARVLRPGGRVAIIDSDWGTAIIHPGDPDLIARGATAMLARFANPLSGRRLRGLLVNAGLAISNEVAETWIQDQDAAGCPPTTFFGKDAVQSGTLTQEQADALQRGFVEAGERGEFHLSLTMYGVAASRPAGVTTSG
jgi:ubiquinone/menaquinone biosynthesis C-methylase UbiE